MSDAFALVAGGVVASAFMVVVAVVAGELVNFASGAVAGFGRVQRNLEPFFEVISRVREPDERDKGGVGILESKPMIYFNSRASAFFFSVAAISSSDKSLDAERVSGEEEEEEEDDSDELEVAFAASFLS